MKGINNAVMPVLVTGIHARPRSHRRRVYEPSGFLGHIAQLDGVGGRDKHGHDVRHPSEPR